MNVWTAIPTGVGAAGAGLVAGGVASKVLSERSIERADVAAKAHERWASSFDEFVAKHPVPADSDVNVGKPRLRGSDGAFTAGVVAGGVAGIGQCALLLGKFGFDGTGPARPAVALAGLGVMALGLGGLAGAIGGYQLAKR